MEKDLGLDIIFLLASACLHLWDWKVNIFYQMSLANWLFIWWISGRKLSSQTLRQRDMLRIIILTQNNRTHKQHVSQTIHQSNIQIWEDKRNRHQVAVICRITDEQLYSANPLAPVVDSMQDFLRKKLLACLYKISGMLLKTWDWQHLMKPMVKQIWGWGLALPLKFCFIQAIVAL